MTVVAPSNGGAKGVGRNVVGMSVVGSKVGSVVGASVVGKNVVGSRVGSVVGETVG